MRRRGFGMHAHSEQSLWSWLISHHPTDSYHLCYRFEIGRFSLHICARCLGLFPAMFATILMGNLMGQWPFWLAWSLLYLAPLPALLDWGTTTASGRPERSNHIRMVTGIGLGSAIGANLHIQTYALLSEQVVMQALYLLGSVWIVWLTSYLRRIGLRKKPAKADRPSLEEYIQQGLHGSQNVPSRKPPESQSKS